MNEVKVFNPKDVTVIYDGMVITGYADGSMVKAEKNEDNMIPHVGVLGEVSVAINANNTGKVTISLANTSPFIKILADKARANIIAPLSVVNMNKYGVNVGGTQAWVTKVPDVNIGKEVESQDIEFFVADYSVD
ncbi:phage structural protein [Sporanaerobacter acetigenes]|uniref:phage structural protein n=1 Tax=Sporanaerobacter acetigenes TaxID=165813 RepID=UPI00104EE213|nr:DUF3277 domain-containing protein [Sporanaerobacter acetigenes]